MDKLNGSEMRSFASKDVQCASLHDFDAFSALEQAAVTVWTLIEDGLDSTAALFAECKNSHDGVADHLKSMRRSYTSSLKSLRKLREFAATVLDGVKQFEQNFEDLQNQISNTALNYGLIPLPDEVLAEIFVLAATTLEEKVALSLVCKRFRRVIMSMQSMWDGYFINSYQRPEQSIAIAEGNRHTSVKARLDPGSPVAFVKWILSLGPEELELSHFDNSSWENFGPILAGGNMPNLRSLVIQYTRVLPSMHILEEWNFPHLEGLEADFVPATELGRNLVWCGLDRIGDNELDSLRDFLANANSLQDLRLFICDTPFNESVDLPSLRSLEVNFIPHPSLAKHLVHFRLDPEVNVRLPKLLDFLSVSTALQELDVSIYFMYDVATANVMTIPSIVTCVISGSSVLIAKLRMPNIRTLRLALGFIPMDTLEEFRTSLQSMTLLEELELEACMILADFLDEIIRFAPHHLGSFSLKGCQYFYSFSTDRPRLHFSPGPQRQLIRFAEGDFGVDFISGVVDYLRSVGLDSTKIEFCTCSGWENEVFGLGDVISAIRS